MRNILTNIRSSQGSVPVPTYDADFQAWIDENILLGHYLPPAPILDAANEFVLDLKSESLWSGFDMLRLQAFNDLDADECSLVCLKSLVKETVYGGMSYTYEGRVANAVDGYTETNFHPSTDGVNYQLNNAGRGGVSFEDSSGTHLLFGTSFPLYRQIMPVNGADRVNIHINATADFTGGSVDFSGVGLKTAYRDSSTSIRLYNKNSEFNRTQIVSASSLDLNVQTARAYNTYYKLNTSFYFFSKSFTQIENEKLRTALNKYLVAIGLTPYA